METDKTKVLTALEMGEPAPHLNDIKNHRIRVSFRDRAGDVMKCDFTAVAAPQEGGNKFKCFLDAERWTADGVKRYSSQIYKDLEYNKASILGFINTIAGEPFKELIIEPREQ